MSHWTGLFILLGIFLLVAIFVYCAKRKFGACRADGCPNYGEAIFYSHKCYSRPQCILGMTPMIKGIWRIKKEVDKDKKK